MIKSFEISNLSEPLSHFGRIENVFFLDYWRAPQTDHRLGACRGLIISGLNLSAFLIGTWKRVEEDLAGFLDGRQENYRTGEVFGWKMTVAKGCFGKDNHRLSKELELALQIHSITPYSDAFDDPPKISKYEALFTSAIPVILPRIDRLSIFLFDRLKEDGVVVDTEPEGTLSCRRFGTVAYVESGEG